jgi:4-aminobutyrate aminotransferase-like enzyme
VNAIKVARAATGRPAVVAFDRAFHGRTLLTLSLTSKLVPYKRGFGRSRRRSTAPPAPSERHGVSSDDAIPALEHLFKACTRRPGGHGEA